ncbi:tetraacyldisaccharide 4'-kinase [Candidatus Fermentibacteria bacterium]|nr:tetraacyldisaccharide 4'-kinase [Candidatus Fermentibacteria bacterium]
MTRPDGIFRAVAARRGAWGLLGRLLYPLGALYGFGAWLRRRAWEAGILGRVRLPVTVVSVGNIEVGGVGKTPVTAWLASRLNEAGLSVAVVARDLNRSSGEPYNASRPFRSNRRNTPSDEVLLLARTLPFAKVYAGPDKSRAAALALEDSAPDVILVDDGFQHLRLARDLDIVVMDFDHPFGTGVVIPSGTLREFPSALRSADWFWVNRVGPGRSGEWIGRALSVLNWRAGLVTSRPSAGKLELLCGGTVEPGGMRVLAFCGIGSPSGFRRTLEEAGCTVCDLVEFPDHHDYAPGDLSRLEADRIAAGADLLVTTEKDAVKIDRQGPALNAGFLKVALEVDGDWKRLLDDIAAMARGRRRGADDSQM